MENQFQLPELHAEHAGWQTMIQGYKASIQSMKDDLAAIVARFSPREVPAHAEHFQNQLILQRDVLDRMRHDFKQYENRIEDEQSTGKIPSDELLQVRNAYLTRLGDFDKLFNDLRTEFGVFKSSESVHA